MIDPDYVMPLFIAGAVALSVWTIRSSLPKGRKRAGWFVKLFRRATDDDDLALARNSDEFYQSTRWRRIRLKAIHRDRGRCVACGHDAESGRRLEVDHKISRKDRPDLALKLANLQTLCNICHSTKGTQHMDFTRDGQREKSRTFWQSLWQTFSFKRTPW